MPTVFTQIIDGKIPGTFVHRDDECVAFLSINPLSYGHTLVVPIQEIDHWVDTPPELAAHMFGVAHKIGNAIQAAFDCERVGLIVAGYEVPHTHIHVFASSTMADFDFGRVGTATPDELESAAAAIRDQL